jgi:hypothetical protein
MKMAELRLKWGTLKAWDCENASPKAQELLESFLEGSSMSCAMDKPDERRKKLLCDLIDEIDGNIHLDWEGKDVTKDEAKKYVMEYGS